MIVQVTPQSSPDFAASGWLKFGGCGSMPGDPTTQSQFATACSFLTAITYHFTEIAGPWFATTPQEIIEIHNDYLRWCDAMSRYGVAQLQPQSIAFSLRNLATLSRRRMQAIEEFGGGEREDYPVYFHLHNVILAAAYHKRQRRKPMHTADINWQTSHEHIPAYQFSLS